MSYRKWLATKASAGPASGRLPLAPLTVTPALDGADMAKGELSHPQMVSVPCQKADVPPQNAVLETPASNDLEHLNVTPEVLGGARLLCLVPILQGVLSGHCTGV